MTQIKLFFKNAQSLTMQVDNLLKKKIKDKLIV